MFDHKLNVEDMIKLCQKNWPGQHLDSGATAVRLIRAGDIMLNNGRRQFDKYNLTPAEFDTLASLRKLGRPYQLAPAGLCQSNLLSSGGLTKVLNNLQARKLIERVDNEQDKRSKLVKLTREGVKLVERVMQDVLSAHERLLVSVLSEKERAQLNSLLSRFHDRVVELP